MEQSKVERVLERHRKLKADKQPWLNTYQLVGEYVMTRKQNFTTEITPGEFLTGKVFDGSAAQANHLMASSLIGALYPNGAKTFQVEPPPGMDKDIAGSEEIKKFYERVTEILVNVMDDPKAGFLTSLEEYMLDQGAFGISGIGVFETDQQEKPIQFVAVDAKKITIDEGADGFVDTVYIEKEMTVRQVIQEYSIENVSKKTFEAFDGGRVDDKVKVLHAIEPRMNYKPNEFGNADMPIGSIHVEVDAKHELRESGYQEMPVFITRFWKAMGEKYGRSPAMEAMPDILEANTLREAAIIATEKMLDPPLALMHDGALGGGTLDTSAGAINVFNISGRMGERQNPVQQLVTVGELNSTYKRIAELVEQIYNAFFIDRLLDLNNETRMTLGEANIRNELRGQSLGTIYARQIAELFVRVIERAFNILLGMGFFGVPQDSQEAQNAFMMGYDVPTIPAPVVDLMMQGADAYKVTFISPASRIMRSEELSGILRTVEFVTNAAGAAPEMLDVLNFDAIVREVQDLTGAPSRILRSTDEVKQMRDARAQQQAAMQQLQAQQIQAETAKAAGMAAQASSKAGLPVPMQPAMGMAA